MTKLDTSSKRAFQGQPPPTKRPLLSQGPSTPDSTETQEDYSREGSLDLFSTAAVGIPDLRAQNYSLYAPEFLGSTNYRAILDEYQIEVEPQSAATETSITTMPWRRPETLLLARTALLHLPSEDTCYRLIDRSLEYPDLGAHLPSLRSLNETFWKHFGTSLANPRKGEGLSAVVDLLFVNTMNCKTTKSDEATAWFQALTGVNSESYSINLLFLLKVTICIHTLE